MTSESPLKLSFLHLCISDDFRIALEIILPLFIIEAGNNIIINRGRTISRAILKSSEIHKQGKDDLKGNSEVI
jgi:hypothetical protein